MGQKVYGISRRLLYELDGVGMKIGGMFMGGKISVDCNSENQAESLLKLMGPYFVPDEETLAFLEKKFYEQEKESGR